MEGDILFDASALLNPGDCVGCTISSSLYGRHPVNIIAVLPADFFTRPAAHYTVELINIGNFAKILLLQCSSIFGDEPCCIVLWISGTIKAASA